MNDEVWVSSKVKDYDEAFLRIDTISPECARFVVERKLASLKEHIESHNGHTPYANNQIIKSIVAQDSTVVLEWGEYAAPQYQDNVKDNLIRSEIEWLKNHISPTYLPPLFRKQMQSEGSAKACVYWLLRVLNNHIELHNGFKNLEPDEGIKSVRTDIDIIEVEFGDYASVDYKLQVANLITGFEFGYLYSNG